MGEHLFSLKIILFFSVLEGHFCFTNTSLVLPWNFKRNYWNFTIESFENDHEMVISFSNVSGVKLSLYFPIILLKNGQFTYNTVHL